MIDHPLKITKMTIHYEPTKTEDLEVGMEVFTGLKIEIVESVTPTWGGYYDVMFTANCMALPMHASHVAQVYVEVAR
jgi:hypothetical protein